MPRILGLFFKMSLLFFIAFFLLMLSGFFAVRFGLTNVSGEEDMDSFEYNKQAEENSVLIEAMANLEIKNAEATSTKQSLPDSKTVYDRQENENWCRVAVAQQFNSHTALSIFEAYHKTHSEVLLNNMLLALKLRLSNRDEFSKKLETCREIKTLVSTDDIVDKFMTASSSNLYSWQNGEPWQIIREAIIKDRDVIYKVSNLVGIQPRLLLSVAIVEQLRLYYTQRELFEKVFKPLQILANANKMAWGVMAIKEKMAIETEDHLKDKNSPFYLGDDFSSLLDFPEYKGDKKEIKKLEDKERYNRLTNKKTHYYSYLYGALILKQFQTAWKQAGFPIEYRPEILATLFNIGFHHSKPKVNPKVGGSTIEIDGEKYYFGSLAFEFYYSGELSEEFPFE